MLSHRTYIAGISGLTRKISLAAILVFLGSTNAPGGDNLPAAAISIGAASYEVELARTPSERSLGLMYRERLPSGRGMLLIYPQPGDHRIWMKNMRFPIRVYWIDADFTVIEMQRLEACLQSPCPVYAAAKPSRFVLELGDQDHAIAPGDRVEGLSGL